MTWNLTTGDCLDILPTLPAESIEACITDPPYGWTMMGSNWDRGVPGEAYWKEVLRVLKPGGWLLAFGGPRTHHRLMVAIEDAGFELKDCLCWLFGSGFPKALNLSKAIDKAAGAERKVISDNPCARPNHDHKTIWIGTKKGKEQSHPPLTAPATPEAKLWDGWHTALKPAHEPIILAMKPLDGTFAKNALTHGVAGLNVDGCRIGTNDNLNGGAYSNTDGRDRKAWSGDSRTVTGAGAFARKAEGEYVPPTGRWPANVILDEEAGKMLDEQTGILHSHGGGTSRIMGFSGGRRERPIEKRSDKGGASRFFYCAKASRAERTHKGTIENNHPTLKPLALMRWLCRLVSTPTGGTILDPFAGSGSTGVAALQEGLSFIGIELSPEYAEIARARLEDTTAKTQPEQLGLDLDQP